MPLFAKAEQFSVEATLCEAGERGEADCPITENMLSGVTGGGHIVEGSVKKGTTTLVIRDSHNTLIESDPIKIDGALTGSEAQAAFNNCPGCVNGQCAAINSLRELVSSRSTNG